MAGSKATTAAKRKATTPAEKQAPAKKAAITPAKKVVQKKVVEKKQQPARAAKKTTAAPATTSKPTKKDTKPAKAAPVVEEESDDEDDEEKHIKQQVSNEDDEDDDDEEELMDDQALLKGIDSSAEEDSSDEDEAEDAEDRAAMMKEDSFAALKDEISLDAKTKTAVKKKLDAVKTKDSTTGVVYLGRIPHGFYEEQMQAYFSQFGKVLRLRLSRNKKTGRSKHYAFIEFTSPEVAEIVADTMNNYLLFGHQLKCKALAKNQIHPALFEGANRKFKPVPWKKIAREKHNAEKTPEQAKQINRKLLKKEAAKRAKLQELGIDYDFPGYQAQVKEKPKHTKFD